MVRNRRGQRAEGTTLPSSKREVHILNAFTQSLKRLLDSSLHSFARPSKSVLG